jgi:hypothetical protein
MTGRLCRQALEKCRYPDRLAFSSLPLHTGPIRSDQYHRSL